MRLLLARYVDPSTGDTWWTLPGGKLHHGEDPLAAVRREVREESGYDASVLRLLGIGSRTNRVDWGIPGGAELHSIGVLYEVAVLRGELTHEQAGSTDRASWVPGVDVAGLERAVIVDIGLDLLRRRPDNGHPHPVPVVGRLRH